MKGKLSAVLRVSLFLLLTQYALCVAKSEYFSESILPSTGARVPVLSNVTQLQNVVDVRE